MPIPPKSIAITLALAVFYGTILRAQDGSPVLQVHEWGTFTSVAGDDGVVLEWRPLTAEDDLPNFVYDHSSSNLLIQGKGQLSTVRMETPVIYFYPDRNMKISTTVKFPDGYITEWYPFADLVGCGITWTDFLAIPNWERELITESHHSHYYPARETDAATLQVKWQQFEKFLFYRGIGTFDLPLQTKLVGSQLTLSALEESELTGVIVFEKQGERMGFRIIDRFKGEVTVSRPELNSDRAQLMKTFEKALLQEGLFRKEARAMLKTWDDQWFEDGLRVFYVLPRDIVDRVLPISISPQPDALERVFVGRAEVITPEMEQHAYNALGSGDIETILEKYGRFAEPILKRIANRKMTTAMRSELAQVLETRNAS